MVENQKLKRGAGILFICTEENAILLLRRSQTSSQPGTWGLPGGNLERGEKPSQAAYRETLEEMGTAPQGRVIDMIKSLGTKEKGKQFEYVTFVTDISQQEKNTWVPQLNEEHDKWEWFQMGFLPKNLHSAVQRLF